MNIKIFHMKINSEIFLKMRTLGFPIEMEYNFYKNQTSLDVFMQKIHKTKLIY